MQLIVGMDAGTHGIRALAVDRQTLSVAAQAEEAYERRCAEGVQELDADRLWQACQSALERLMVLLPAHAQISGIGVTHQRGTIIPVDKTCKPLAAAMCDSDARALEASALERYGTDAAGYYLATGCPFVPFNGMAKLLWVREHDAALYDHTYAWLSPQDFLMSRLTGRLTVSEGSAPRNGYYGIRTNKMAQPWASLMLPHSLTFTPLACAVGQVATGALSGTPLAGAQVFAVPGDQPAAVIGCGATGDEIALNLGTTFVASMYAAEPCLDPGGMVTVELLPEGAFAMEYGTGAGGQFMDWYARLALGAVPEDALGWARLEALAAQAPLGSLGLLAVPLLWHATSPDIQGRFANLRLDHDSRHMARSVYEGLAYEAVLSIEKMEAVTGRKAGGLRVFGGMSQSDLFLKILAAATQKRVSVAAQKQASAYGAALVAAQGLGGVRALQQACAPAAVPARVYDFGREEAEQYHEWFKRYKTLR